ncbi:CAP domain-containing protein, partial [uncultured Cellulomonas sp.]|uniref:CAP domain-containing protein n=1 Tax=uncultured Cellulomonas sp. TaxID=189682 RepID=UPI0028F0BD05
STPPAEAQPPAPVEPPPPPPPTVGEQIVTLTNAERVAAGLTPFTVSPCATDQATARTALLVAEDRFEHDPLEPILEACAARAVGENIALGYPTPAAVVAGWMGSPGHRANILNPDYTQIGVGCTTGPKGALCAQVFVG